MIRAKYYDKNGKEIEKWSEVKVPDRTDGHSFIGLVVASAGDNKLVVSDDTVECIVEASDLELVEQE